MDLNVTSTVVLIVTVRGIHNGQTDCCDHVLCRGILRMVEYAVESKKEDGKDIRREACDRIVWHSA